MLWALFSAGLCCQVQAAELPVPTPDAEVRIRPAESFNLVLEEYLPPDRLIVRLTTPAHNWFAGILEGLPIDRPLTIGLSMTGNETKANTADVRKWQGLRPVMTYADPTCYPSYECFVRQGDGQWLSQDPLKRGEDRLAGTATTPRQTVVPEALAAECLSADGRFWSPWREVEAAAAVPALNIFRVTQTFRQSTATLSMRVPFSVTVQEEFLTRLAAAQFPGVTIETPGTTPGGRKLQVVRVDDPAATAEPSERRTILLIAREHATEPASSWAAFGALSAILADTPEGARLRKAATWLVLLIEDPDGTAEVQFDRMTDRFLNIRDPATPPEVYAYGRYIADYIYDGHPIDITVSLHNVEANECAHICTPFADRRYLDEVFAINTQLFAALRQQAYATGAPDQPWDRGFMPNRLYGWCALRFSALDLAFEVNDRYPGRRLHLGELQQLGGTLARELATWSQSTAGAHWHAKVQKSLTLQQLERAAYYERVGYGPEQRSHHDLMIRGY